MARLTESDWRQFAVVRLRALSDTLGEHDEQYRQESTFTAAQWRRRLREHAQFAALRGELPVGLIGAQRESDDRVYLYSLWLDPSVRGHGLARRLVAAAVAWAQEQRAVTVTLRVAAENGAARAVYESVGFAVAGPVGADDEIAMSLTVS